MFPERLSWVPLVFLVGAAQKLILLLKFIVPLVSLGVSVNSYVSTKSNFDNYDSIVKSWTQLPIQDVIPIAAGASCANGYSLYSVATYPGMCVHVWYTMCVEENGRERDGKKYIIAVVTVGKGRDSV